MSAKNRGVWAGWRQKGKQIFRKKAGLERLCRERPRDRLTLSRAFFRALISDREVDLTFKGVDSRNENADFIPD